MGSGNTKVKKINQPPSTPAKKKDEKRVNEASTLLDHKSSGTAASDFSKSTVNSESQEQEDWVPPGMVEESEVEKKSLITSEELIMGKKKLKTKSQSNNNSNISVEDGKKIMILEN